MWTGFAPRYLLLVVLMGVGFAIPAAGQQFHRQSFEGSQTQLRLGPTNGEVELLDHEIVEDAVHTGKRAERLAVRVTSGDFALVEYSVTPNLIFEELEITAYVRTSAPGTQIQARVVLPRATDPKTGEPLVTLLAGTTCETTNRYQKLAVTRLDKLLSKQQAMLQNEQGRSIDVTGAYVDQVVFDIHSGIGEYEARFDDIVVGPMVLVPNREAAAPMAQDPQSKPRMPLPLRTEEGEPFSGVVPEVASREDLLRARIRGEQLIVRGKPFFPRAMARSDAPLRVFRETGMNLVFEPFPVSPESVAEAAQLDLLLAPMLPMQRSADENLDFAAQTQFGATYDDLSIFYYVGGPLDRLTAKSVESTLLSVRRHDPRGGRPFTGDVVENVRGYSRQLDMVGTARFPLMTSMSLGDYQRWLSQRKSLAVPGTFFWSWVQTHAPAEVVRLAYGHDLSERAFDLPVGPQPEQIKLATYASIAAGARGVVFTSDRWVGESAKGRARMLQLALLNTELTLIEPFVADGQLVAIQETSHPDIEAAVFRHSGGRGVLAILRWKKAGSQFVVGQASANNVQVIIPAPESAQAFLVSPAEVRGIKRYRDFGGIRVTIDEFDTVACVVLSTDTKLYANYQELVAQLVPRSAGWQRELAEIHLANTETTTARLEASGHPQAEAQKLLVEANKELEDCRASIDRTDYRSAFAHANRSMRRCRLVQYNQWTAAVPDVATAVASPFAVSYFTLPEHYAFQDNLARLHFGDNKLTGGDFEGRQSLESMGWSYDPYTADDVKASATLVERSKENGRAIMLGVEPSAAEAPLVLDRTSVRVSSPAIPVEPGQVARIRGSIRVVDEIRASVDGAMVWDSIGGESLALRFTKKSDWREFELSRPIRESGELRLNLVLTGIGQVQFDDLSITLSSPTPLPIAGRPSSEPR